jgi:hypothetical protein
MVPDITHRAYRDLVLGEKQPELKCLALKILLGRMQSSTRQNRSIENIERQVSSLHAFFCQNELLAKRDIETIFKL